MKADDEGQQMQAGALRLDATKEAPSPGSTALGQPDTIGVDADIKTAIERGDLRGAVLLCAERHAEAVGRLCMALLGSQADAEDVVQETLIDAYRGLGGWRAEGSLRAWLFGIARRKCAREIERGQRRRAKLRLVGEAEGEGPREGAELVAQRRRAESAREALGTLRPSEREAVVLRFGAGLSFREVAEACGIDEAAARKRVSRGIAALRSRLTEELP
jgi:RNA polymerase sigma-70 factor (ECF subfamily)